MMRYLAVACALVYAYFALGYGSELDDDETLIKIIDKHGAQLVPIAQIIWEAGPDAIIDLRSGSSFGPKLHDVRIEPSTFRSRISQQHIDTLYKAGVVLADTYSKDSGVRFVTGLGGIGISGDGTGLIWKGMTFDPELLVPHLKNAVLKERKNPNLRSGYEFIRQVNEDWAIFYEST